MKHEETQLLIRRLIRQPQESEWLEFKQNNDNPQDIGEYISALANSAALHNKPFAYIVWGVKDQTHELLGTTFKPRLKKIGDQELENWLTTQLEPPTHVNIIETENPHIVIFEIQAAETSPVRFKGEEYVRVGSYKKKLKDHVDKEKLLWTLFSNASFEEGIAKANVTSDNVLDLINYPGYFRLTGQSLPDNRTAILEKLTSEQIIVDKSDGVYYDITNIGAILFAYDLRKFGRLARKVPRVIIYQGVNRTQALKEQGGSKGYAVGFEGLIDYINDQFSRNEFIEDALRREARMYPEIAIRELVANALIHQDFSLTGTGPMIEIFTDRVEISNPGTPLISTLRFIDEPPQSRNEILAALMRRMNICEERGSGIDKVIFNVEAFQLPAPEFRATEKSTVTVLYGPKEFANLDKEGKIRACYQHACLCYVSGKPMTNTTLRKRLDINQQSYPIASKIIRDAIQEKLVKAHSQSSSSKKDAKYVPFWA